MVGAEELRLIEEESRQRNWKRWGPYLAERHWGTVREDYSANGDAWNHLPYDQARRVAYRWGEDGLLGWTDRQCRVAFRLSLWNGKDSHLKERLFGLSNPQGNHGEDVKEHYFYLDSTPTHSYTKALYKYPHAQFPYKELVEQNAGRNRLQREYEIDDVPGVFDDEAYWDVSVEYAKADVDDTCILVTATNRSESAAPDFHFIPQVWFRNGWSWGCTHEGCGARPRMRVACDGAVQMVHETLGSMQFLYDSSGEHTLMMTENDTNFQHLYGSENETPFTTDAFHRYVVDGEVSASRTGPKAYGSKAGVHFQRSVAPGASVTFKMRLRKVARSENVVEQGALGEAFDAVMELRKRECDEFYTGRLPASLTQEEAHVARTAYAGLMWSKTFYHYIVQDWLQGDASFPPPPSSRRDNRNGDWPHLYARDVLLVPETWEYPWPAVWDLAFHAVAVAEIDVSLAKEQLLLQLREWYMHPNGCLPAYEWNLSDVNPPVHAWACWRVYKIARNLSVGSEEDQLKHARWLSRCFQKLVINFTWWVNRTDKTGKHLFGGGFLGLDNIGLFDRSEPLPTGGFLEQADGTAWMAMYALVMLKIAIELAVQVDITYEDSASKFFNHFLAIADAMNSIGGGQETGGLWHEDDGFYYDRISGLGDEPVPLRVRSLVGLVPLFASANLPACNIEKLPGFRSRMEWALQNRSKLADLISMMVKPESGALYHLAIPSRDKVQRVLKFVVDETEFLSQHGIRSLSKFHEENPVSFAGKSVGYVPGESDSAMFGGNSNWRGPIWFPMNFLLLESLSHFDNYYGEELQIEYPSGSGLMTSLECVRNDLTQRLVGLFLPDEDGVRPCNGANSKFAASPHWKDLVYMHEFFHGDTGEGLGASHQTGWTALVASLIQRLGRVRQHRSDYAEPLPQAHQ